MWGGGGRGVLGLDMVSSLWLVEKPRSHSRSTLEPGCVYTKSQNIRKSKRKFKTNAILQDEFG